MPCQNCGHFAAVYHYESNINGQVTRQHLCAQCAAGFAGRLFQSPMQFTPRRALRRVPAIHTHLPEYAIEPNEQNIPSAAEPALQRRRRQNQLKQKLNHAIRQENYEQAAQLRDELYKLRQNG